MVTTLFALKKRHIKTYLMNGRVSEKTMRKLKHIPFITKPVLKCFDQIYVQDKKYIKFIKSMSDCTPIFLGNLKFSAPVPVPDERTLNTFTRSIKGRPVWLAVSTHPEDEEFINPAITSLHKAIPNLLTVIVPRHPERLTHIENSINKMSYAVRSRRESILNTTDIYIADTIGELTLFLSAIDVCFIGGSTTGGYGGHNPLEPANLDCAIVQGTDTNHFAGICTALNAVGGQIQVRNSYDLSDTIKELLTNDKKRNSLIKGAKSVASDNKNIADIIMQSIKQNSSI